MDLLILNHYAAMYFDGTSCVATSLCNPQRILAQVRTVRGSSSAHVQQIYVPKIKRYNNICQKNTFYVYKTTCIVEGVGSRPCRLRDLEYDLLLSNRKTRLKPTAHRKPFALTMQTTIK